MSLIILFPATMRLNAILVRLGDHVGIELSGQLET
jgi:hypothetical protein